VYPVDTMKKMNTHLVLRIISAAILLSIGELILLIGLPWFSSPTRFAYIIAGSILSISAIAYLCDGLLNDSKIKIMVKVVSSVVLAIVGTISLVTLSYNLEFSDALLGGSQYVTQELSRIMYILNIIIIHAVLIQKSITRSNIRRIAGSLIANIFIVLVLDLTLGELSNSFPIEDSGFRGWILVAIYTPILWLTTLAISNKLKA
jgi:hypothetical protein